ncbi:hypothetical protein ACIQUS_25590 [Pseudomonas sp. NPDC090755]|uniref:hypothetical protein n=1 Tax=Pseudomonas sp. NPDC090755 TaxID=3364481 RepID=UPI00383B6750
MAQLLEHIGPEPITIDDVIYQCRLDADDVDGGERELIERIVIPAARGLVEHATGAAVRKGVYRDHLPSVPGGSVFAVSLGQAYELDSAAVGISPVARLLDPAAMYLVNGGQESLLYTQSGQFWRDLVGDAPQGLLITYKAGIDIEKFPSVQQYLLLAAAWAYRHRELLAVGQALHELPESYLLTLLAPITVPPRI